MNILFDRSFLSDIIGVSYLTLDQEPSLGMCLTYQKRDGEIFIFKECVNATDNDDIGVENVFSL